jgi:hypothetical protein
LTDKQKKTKLSILRKQLKQKYEEEFKYIKTFTAITKKAAMNPHHKFQDLYQLLYDENL